MGHVPAAPLTTYGFIRLRVVEGHGLGAGIELAGPLHDQAVPSGPSPSRSFIALADLVGFDRTAAGIQDVEALLRDKAEIEGLRSCDAAEVIYATLYACASAQSASEITHGSDPKLSPLASNHVTAAVPSEE